MKICTNPNDCPYNYTDCSGCSYYKKGAKNEDIKTNKGN